MRTAVIGAGRMGRRHIRVVKEMGLELVGICDARLEALEEAANEQPLSETLRFTDPATLLTELRPDCVVIATTADSHCRLTCLAAEAGARFLLCEKPMACSLRDCDRMIETCRANGTALAINHQMRFMEQYTEPKRIVESDAFGGLSSIVLAGGNFGMAMNGVHYFEMFRYMTDEPPFEVTAWLSDDPVPNPRGVQFEDRAGAVRATNRSGKRFFMEIGSDQGHGDRVIYSGPYGQLVVDELAGTMSLSVRREQYRSLPTTRYGMPAEETSFTIAPADVIGPTRSVLNALLNGGGPPTGEDGRLAVACLVAAFVSHEGGHVPVRVDEAALPLDRMFSWA